MAAADGYKAETAAAAAVGLHPGGPVAAALAAAADAAVAVDQ